MLSNADAQHTAYITPCFAEAIYQMRMVSFHPAICSITSFLPNYIFMNFIAKLENYILY